MCGFIKDIRFDAFIHYFNQDVKKRQLIIAMFRGKLCAVIDNVERYFEIGKFVHAILPKYEVNDLVTFPVLF